MLLFDLDGTLLDSNGIWEEVDRAFLRRRGFPYTKAYQEGVAHTAFPLAAVFTKEYCRLSESCEEIIAEWMELARDRYAHTALKPGVRAYLERQRAAGERMALFTNCQPVHCETALRVHGLAPYFERVFYAQSLGLDKRSADAFRRVAALLGVPASDCTVFDDSSLACRSAKECGMRVVGVADRFFADAQDELRAVCDRYVASMEELL